MEIDDKIRDAYEVPYINIWHLIYMIYEIYIYIVHTHTYIYIHKYVYIYIYIYVCIYLDRQIYTQIDR